jgi:hypothetical protein
MNKHEQGGNTNAHLDEALTRHRATINWEYRHDRPNYLNQLHSQHNPETSLAYIEATKFRMEANAFAYQADIPIMDKTLYDSGLVVGLEVAKRGLRNVNRVDIYSDVLLTESFESFPLDKDVANPQAAWKELRDQYAHLAEPFADTLKSIRIDHHFSDIPYVDLAVACGYALSGAQKMIQRYRETDRETWKAEMTAMRDEFAKREQTDPTQSLETFNTEYQTFLSDSEQE